MDETTHRRSRWQVWSALASAGILASSVSEAHQAVPPELVERVVAGVPLADTQDGLIAEGMRLFMQETFGGNGRTCATCHPPENNFTIDPEFIRRLPSTDLLFVAERNPDLQELEIPALMRERGLILENLDGFDQPGVMRGVPHTLGMSQSITPEAVFPLVNATGWSGDGAPQDGSLANFAVGAVMQHFPQTLNRIEGVDFRLPTEAEINALLAFQLFSGRQEEMNIDPADPNALAFTDVVVERGKILFNEAPNRSGETRSCAGCHGNAGANNADGENRNFVTGVAFAATAPACVLPGVVPGDGGFGREPVEVVDSTVLCPEQRSFPITFRGDQTMNTPSLIEAADTPPLFHDNSAATIEDAVRFYTSDTFNNSPAGEAGGGAFVLTDDQVNAIAAVLRALNALENIRSSNAFARFALREPSADAILTLRLTLAQTEDAIRVLTGGPVRLFPNSGVMDLLSRARGLEREALERTASDPLGQGSRGALPVQGLLEEAITLQEQARRIMLVP